MFNKTVTKVSPLKVLDELVLPAILLVAVRFIGFFLAGLIWPIEFTFGLKSNLISLPFIQVEQPADLFIANSFSWVLVGLALAVVFCLVLFRILSYHQDHLHPKEAARTHNRNLDFLIIEPQEASSRSVSWFVLTLVSAGLAASDFWTGSLSAAAFGLVGGIDLTLGIAFWQVVVGSSFLERKKV
jgi:hypothetical protein